MKSPVYILATVRKAEMLPAALLVFATLRVGFPDADVMVYGNGLTVEFARVLQASAKSVGAGFANVGPTSHDVWIESLVNRQFKPFWIVDTDVVFFGPLPAGGKGKEIVAGRYEPEFLEEWTMTRHVARLHTAVMWIEPTGVRSTAREWTARFPLPWRNSAEFTWIRQHFIPATHVDEVPLFYDTMAGVCHATRKMDADHEVPSRARAFTAEEDHAFEHLHCGTYVDLMESSPDGATFGKALREFHQRVYENPALARGARQQQDEFYRLRALDLAANGETTAARRKKKGKK